MKYCLECGATLTSKVCADEGMVSFCEACQAFRFEPFSVSILMVLFNKDKTKICLLRQNYVHTEYAVLIAGYVKKGETLEQTVYREVFEETGLSVAQMAYVSSQYHEKSGALMVCFWGISVDEKINVVSSEVDLAAWVNKAEALSFMRPNSMGQKHLKAVLERVEAVEA